MIWDKKDARAEPLAYNLLKKTEENHCTAFVSAEKLGARKLSLRLVLTALYCLMSVCAPLWAKAESVSSASEQAAEENYDLSAMSDLTEDYLSLAEDYLDMDEIDELLEELLGTNAFSFRDTVLGLLKGQVDVSWDNILETISGLLLGEWRQQRQLAVQILLVAFASAIFTNFVRVFDSHQISDISFYMTFLVVSALLMDAFAGLASLVSETCESLNTFMRILLPSYVITVVLSAGSITALSFYELTILAIGLMQTVVIRLVIPAVHFYFVILLLNQISTENCFFRLAQLMETLISWGMRSVLGIVAGLQAVQCLVTPAVDSLKNSAFGRAASVIPGIGAVLNAAVDTVAGAAVVIKNAAGVGGIIALIAICFAPLVKLIACILLFRLICAAIEPVCERRMVEGIDSLSRGASLLLQVMASSLAMFVISLAMIIASVRGG